MRKLFWKARTKAKSELRNQLSTFQDTLTRGLSRMFGPTDSDLLQSMDNRNKELQIIEQVLLPVLERYAP